MTPPPSRALLLALLAEACELEHTLACSYLFAAFSLKQDVEDLGSIELQQRNRRWSGQVYHVAAQEMLHLAQAWNLMTAVGGAPHAGRPSFPQGARTFPLPVALVLRRFDQDTLERFLYYESPHHEGADPACPLPARAGWPIDHSMEYDTVGALYAACAEIIEALDERELFVGEHDHQLGRTLVHFPDIVLVRDRSSALAAIHRIVFQGEGSHEDREDSHYGVFRSIRDQLAGAGGDPAFPVGDNPYVRRRADIQVLHGNAAFADSDLTTTEVSDPAAVLAIDLFDDAYAVMLQALVWLFSHGSRHEPSLHVMSTVALELMITVIKPLGEAICRLPSGADGRNAGPAFGLGRRQELAYSSQVALKVVSEQLTELERNGQVLSAVLVNYDPSARDKVRSASGNLGRLALLARDASGSYASH